MDKHLFFPAQEPQPSELDAAFQDTIDNLANRMTTLLEPGIVPTYKMYLATGGANWQLLFDAVTHKEFSVSVSIDSDAGASPLAINVGAGLAFDSANERIIISSLDSTVYDAANLTAVDSLGNSIARSTGCVAIPCTNNATNYVYIAYLHQVNTSTPGGADPVNNYTVDPDTGTLDYVSRLDGYQIKVQATLSTDPDDIYLGKVVTAAGKISTIDMVPRLTLSAAASAILAVTVGGHAYLDYTVITTTTLRIDGGIAAGDAIVVTYTSGGATVSDSFTIAAPLRKSGFSSAALALATVPAAAGDITSTYVAGMPVTVDEHIRSVGNVTYVSAKNPHAVMAEDIYDATGRDLPSRFGAYSDSPQAFQSNGIVDETAESAQTRADDPFYANLTLPNATNVLISQPVASQTLYLNAIPYTNTSYFFSEIANGATFDETEVAGGVDFQCDFTAAGRASTGYYYIYLDSFTSGAGHTGPCVRAEFTGETLVTSVPDMLLHPENYVTATGKFFLALVYWNSGTSNFASMTDPVTGTTGVYALDMRKFGLIADEQLQYTRRHYTVSSGREIDQMHLNHNLYLDEAHSISFAGSGLVSGSRLKFDTTANKLLLYENGNVYGVGSGDAIKWIAQGPALAAPNTGAPVVQTVMARPGRITRVMVFSRTRPGTTSLKLDIMKCTDITRTSIFSTVPEIAITHGYNCTGNSASRDAVRMELTTAGGVLAGDVGTIDAANNTVTAGDRLQLYITQVGTTPNFGGDDLLVTVFIE